MPRIMTRDDPPLIVHVFLSSPGDVPEERAAARDLLKAELSYDPLLRGKVMFDVTSWDDPAAPAPLLPTQTPQSAVNRFLRRPGQCHIVIAILAGRLGTPLDPSVHLRPDGSAYPSGTIWEFEDALNATPQPDILLYRRADAPNPDVDAFLARFRNPDGSLRGLWTDYSTPADFLRRLTNDVKYLLRERLDATAATTRRGRRHRAGAAKPAGAAPPSAVSGPALVASSSPTTPAVPTTVARALLRGPESHGRRPVADASPAATPQAPSGIEQRNLFCIQERTNSIPACAELDVDSTQGSTRDSFDLVAELRFGWPEFYVDATPIRYGVDSAMISLGLANCAIMGARLGDVDHPCIVAEGNNSWRITGPVENGLLRRRALGDEALCTIKAATADEIRLELCLSCRQYNIHYDFVTRNGPGALPTEEKILALFYNKSLGFEIDMGVVTLSRIVLTVEGTGSCH